MGLETARSDAELEKKMAGDGGEISVETAKTPMTPTRQKSGISSGRGSPVHLGGFDDEGSDEEEEE